MALFQLSQLRIPLVTAPMAGGPSTPSLAAAAARVGAFGFLAGGYKTVDALAAHVQELRSMTDAPFGVNLFVPTAPLTAAEAAARSAAVAGYRAELEPEAARYGVALPQTDATDTDRWEDKLGWLLEHPVPVVSFTFGVPEAATIDRLKAAGTHVMVTVTDPAEAEAAVRVGADSVCLQGPDAGGHRGTHAVAKVPDATPLLSLVERVAAEQSVPVVAAGGVCTGAQVSALRRAGARAVQVGTLLLCSPECGASAAHKQALASSSYAETTVTRAFSGRPARGLSNRFIRDHDASAPAAYPELNQLVRPIRAAAAAAGDPDGLALWAGTGFGACRTAPAGEILTELWADALAADRA